MKKKRRKNVIYNKSILKSKKSKTKDQQIYQPKLIIYLLHDYYPFNSIIKFYSELIEWYLVIFSS